VGVGENDDFFGFRLLIRVLKGGSRRELVAGAMS
jgi:hypothetical protein